MTKDKQHINVPHLRFPEFTGEWERKSFKDVCNITTGNKNTQDKSDDGIYPFYVRSQIVERINSWTFDGEAILTAGDGVGVGKVFHYSTGKIGVHQRVYILSDFKCDGKYLYSYFAGNFYNRVKRMSAKNSVDSVRMEMIADMPISLPSTEEQKKIGHLLALLDERIATQNKIIKKYESLIKGLVVTHYSTNLHTIKVKIGDLGETYSTMAMSKEQLTENGNPCIFYGELFTIYGCVIDKVKSRTWLDKNSSTLSSGRDLLFPASTTVDALSLIAPSALLERDIILGGDMFGIKISKEYNPLYLSYYFNYIDNKRLSKYAKGTTIIHLHYNEITNVVIELPCIEEQDKIVTAIQRCSTKLALEKTLLQRLSNLKQYLLSQMLI